VKYDRFARAGDARDEDDSHGQDNTACKARQ
jgi:hypothetical protein